MTAPALALPHILTNAARAIRDAEDAADYLANPPPDHFGVQLSWTWGASSPGQKAVLDKVRARVEAQMSQMIRFAVDELTAEANQAKDAVRRELGL